MKEGGSASTALPLASASASSDHAPLPEGTLSTNLGCNIVVVCNKVSFEMLVPSCHLADLFYSRTAYKRSSGMRI